MEMKFRSKLPRPLALSLLFAACLLALVFGCLHGIGATASIILSVGFLCIFLTWSLWEAIPAIARAGTIIVGIVMTWFGAVDLTGEYERCEYCRSYRQVVKVRVLGVSVVRRTVSEYEYLASRLAADLGTRCPHSYRSGLCVRLYGMLISASIAPEEAGGYLLEDGKSYEWYGQEERRKWRRLGATIPGFADDFRRRVLFEHDFEYFHSLLNRIRTCKGMDESEENDTDSELGSDHGKPFTMR